MARREYKPPVKTRSRQAICVSLPMDMYNELRMYSIDSGVQIGGCVREAVKRFLSEESPYDPNTRSLNKGIVKSSGRGLYSLTNPNAK